MVLPNDAAEKASTINLMSMEIEGIANGIAELHDHYAAFLEIGLGLYLLSNIIGEAAFVVTAPVICMFVLHSHCSTYTYRVVISTY